MMNTPVLKLPRTRINRPLRLPVPIVIFGLLLAIWAVAPSLIYMVDETAGFMDQGIWLPVILSLISFMLITGLVWWLLQNCWRMAGLPALNQMVLNFKSLLLWQQLAFYWASFALLLLAASLCLLAIC